MSDRGSVVYDLLRHVRPIVLSSARELEARVREVGWTVGSRAVVEVLAEMGPATVPQVAARLSLARQNVQRHIDELLPLGHAQTSPNPLHRRSVLVRLTPEGRDAFERIHARELEDLASLANACSDEELAVASHVLAVLDRDIRARVTGDRRGTS